MSRARDIADSARYINTLDGIAATLEGADLNILDGVTATTAEINYVDGVTSAIQTQFSTATAAINTKAPTASPTFTGTAAAPTINASTALQIGGVAITSTPAELNILDGVTSTAAEINKLDGVTASTAEINYLDGVTSDLQAQITSAAASGGGGGEAAYAVKTAFSPPVYFKKVDIIPNNQTVVGTWECFANAELWVSELTTITSNDEYMAATESKSNHIFYGTGYIGDDAVVTVTDTMQGLGDADAAGGFSKTSISAIDTGGEGSFSYNNSTGAYTYTGPSLGKLMFLGSI
jgi:hypothetical protein